MTRKDSILNSIEESKALKKWIIPVSEKLLDKLSRQLHSHICIVENSSNIMQTVKIIAFQREVFQNKKYIQIPMK